MQMGSQNRPGGFYRRLWEVKPIKSPDLTQGPGTFLILPLTQHVLQTPFQEQLVGG